MNMGDSKAGPEHETGVKSKEIIIACLVQRLTDGKRAVPGSLRELTSSCGNRKWNQSKYTKYLDVFYSPRRIYKKINNFKKCSKDDLLEHIQQHSTCLKAEIYKNITWLQVLDLLQLIVDLCSECIECGKGDYIKSILDWCESFLNRFELFKTSQEWGDAVIMLPPCKSNKYTRDCGNEPQEETHAAKTSDVNADESCEDSDDETKDDTVDEAADDTVDGAADDTVSTDKRFINPPCACGNRDRFIKNGNFFIICKGCDIFTCLICMRSIKGKGNVQHHLGRHLLIKDSPITKSHIEKNNSLVKHKCNNVKCGKTGFCQNYLVDLPTTALCKICNYSQCVRNDCDAAFSKHSDFHKHRLKEHRNEMRPKGEKLSRPGKPIEKGQLNMLRCGCNNKSKKITRIGNFGGMCESMAHILCLLCGQEQESQYALGMHLLAHNVDINAPATEEHTAQNLNMFNYICLHCDKKGSVKNKSVKKKNYLQCRFCDTYQCLDSLCQKTYSTYKGFMQHRIVKHS